MQQFLKDLQAVLGNKSAHLLVSFNGDNVTVITTVKRPKEVAEIPLKISGTIEEVSTNFFSVIGTVASDIVKLDDNTAQAKEELAKQKKDAEPKAAAAPKAPVKSKEEIAAEKEAEKAAKAAEKEQAKLDANKDWTTAKTCFKLKQYGLAQTNAAKVLLKFPDNANVKGMITECKIGLTTITRADAEKEGHKQWSLPDVVTSIAGAAGQGLKPNENFDNEVKGEEPIEGTVTGGDDDDFSEEEKVEIIKAEETVEPPADDDDTF